MSNTIRKYKAEVRVGSDQKWQVVESTELKKENK